MKILIVSSEIIVNRYSGSIRTSKIIKELSESHIVDVLTEPTAVWDFKHNIRDVYYIKSSKKVFKNKTFIEKLLTKFFFINLNIHFRYKAFRAKLKEIDLDEYDFILALGGGGFFEPLKALSKMKTKALKVGFVHDPFPGHVFPEPYKTDFSLSESKKKKSLKKCFARLDKIAFPSLILSEWMLGFYDFDKNKIVILPHLLPEISLPDNSDLVDAFISENSLKNNKFYLHTGTLLKHRPVQIIIDQFKKLKIEGELSTDFKLVFIGNVHYNIQESDNDIVIINKRLPLDLINGISAYAKSLVILEHLGEISPFLPGKFPEYISIGKDIMHFGPRNSEVCRIAEKFTDLNKLNAELDQVDQIHQVLKYGGVNFSNNEFFKDYFSIKGFLENFSPEKI